MIPFSEGTSIALHAMVYIANRPDKFVSLKEIAKTFEVSDNHLSKILQQLVKADFLSSAKGPAGGFKLVPGKEKSTFMEIYEVINGKRKDKECLFNDRKHHCPACIMGEMTTRLNRDFDDYMNSRRIGDFSL